MGSRGTIDGYQRLPDLRLESELDFYTGYRTWARQDIWQRTVNRAAKLFEQQGINPHENELSYVEVAELLESDPLMAFMVHSRETTQQIMYRGLREALHADLDMHLDEMDDAQKKGPGTLELHPETEVPDYAKHEIHLQPGGYVGDPLGGHIYYHSLNVEMPDGNFQDKLQIRMASEVPVPEDARVNRILEQGCSAGQMTVALKRRFPDAEVWGNDIGGPMLRFAHMRSVSLGVETHFMHELCEKSTFPDEHFDVITNFLLYHEIPEQIGRDIIHESFRLLRPGGVWYPIDLYTSKPPEPSAYEKFFWWFDHRWNHEVWTLEYRNLAMDFEQEMRRAGFDIHRNPREGRAPNIVGIKPA